MTVRLRFVLLPVALGALGAGCGSDGPPRMARADVAPLIRLADRVSHEGPCAQARDIRLLHHEQAVLVRARRIPRELTGPLSAGVDALVAQTPVCLPAVARSVPAPPPPPPPLPPQPDDRKAEHGHDRGEHGHDRSGHGHDRGGHGHGHGHDKHGGDHRDEGGD
jgi:hypothetical protein